MANRFVGLIRAGRIGTVPELKSLFKRLAKETHPDLASADRGGVPAIEFIQIREEYEHALGEFDRYRFGSRRRERLVLDRRALYLSLEILFARGFPKTPRHAKEKERYDYARFAFLENMKAADSGAGESIFHDFEHDLFGLKARDPGAVKELRAWMSRLLDYHRSGIGAFIVELRLGALRLGARFPEAAGLAGFLGFLVAGLDGGPALMAKREG